MICNVITHYVMLYCIMLWYCSSMVWYGMVCNVMTCYVMLYSIMLCHIMLCYIMTYNVMISYVMICHVMLSCLSFSYLVLSVMIYLICSITFNCWLSLYQAKIELIKALKDICEGKMYVEGESAQLHLTLAKILEEGTTYLLVFVHTYVQNHINIEFCINEFQTINERIINEPAHVT